MQFIIKIILSSIVVTGASELAKRSTLAGAIIASLPLTSILAIVWLYLETKDVSRVQSLSMGIFWAVIPSLLFFIALTALLKLGLKFHWSMVLACTGMTLAYCLYTQLMSKLGTHI